MSVLQVELISILDDNYVFLIQDTITRKTALIDPGESVACLKSLNRQGLELDYILVTHHHADHIDGIAELKSCFPKVKIYAPIKNKMQIPGADFYVDGGSVVFLEGLGKFEVLDLPGHTMGHIAYFLSDQKWLFCGDVLFGLGCGRLFEGTAAIAFQTLQKIKALPVETQIFCAHEYTMPNLKFVQELIENKKISAGYDVQMLQRYEKKLKQKRSKQIPSVPLKLRDEKNCNPFLFASSVEDFARLRQMRNVFRPMTST